MLPRLVSSRPKVLRWGAIAAVCAGLLLASAPAAHAEDPVDLDGAYVLDTVGAIAGDEGRVLAALDDLYDRARIQLFVVYVDSFTGTGQGDWATETAIVNGLGTSDVLLAIATEDRNFEVSVADDFALSDAQLATVEEEYLIPELRDDRWADAAIAAAEGYAIEATGVVGPNMPTSGPDADDPVASGGGIPILPIVGGVAVVGVGVFIYSRVRKRNADGAVTSVPERMTQKQLDQRAGSLLVQLDDSLKTSEQELGFAVAQFGDAATADFTATLASAKAKVAEAFALKQKLDDAETDSDSDRRAWSTQIIQLCEAADAELDAQADAFDELRQLEKTAPAALIEVRAAADAAKTRKSEAAATVTSLATRFSPEAVDAVAGNVAQADKLLVFANAAAAKADEAIAAGRPSDAAIAVRTAQASVGQTTQLFDAIDTLAADLTEASTKLAAAVSDTTHDIAAARALPQDATSASLAPAIAAAESALSAAGAASSDPIVGLAEVERANAALEQVFVGVRDTQQKIAAAQSQLDAALTSARSQVASADSYIATRRGSVGSTARTRASEAQRHLAEAEAASVGDPVTALAAAQQAAAMAASALQFARNDVSGWERRESLAQQERDGYYDGSDGADLGGILSDLFGGGGSGSSWSSGRSGSSYRPSSSSRSSRSSRSGSFGGSSRSSSRSSGGRRSRGGRF